MKENGIVSVIVPVYNTAPYLPRCIESIISQSYRSIELLLIDDGSTDGSLEICHGYMTRDSRIRVLHKENGGVCSARNMGLREMRGDFFLFVDSDDALETEIIGQSMDTFFRYPEADMVVFGWKKIFDNGKTDFYLPRNELVTDMSGAVQTLLAHYNGYGGGYPNKLWKTEAFGGNIPEYNESLFYFEDMEWMTRMFLGIRSFACLERNGYLYYIRGDSTTFRTDNTQKKERGYHMSALQIVEDLAVLPEVQNWFQERYYPEIVNGVLHAWKNYSPDLSKWLLLQMRKISRFVLASRQISLKIKFRCRVLSLVFWIR